MTVMDVQPSTGTAQSGMPTSPQTSALSGDFETFLKMLTVQMRNQDPLNPIETADFAVQLATFSGVEQQVRTNQLLEAAFGSRQGAAAYADWIGREASAPVAAVFDGAPLTVTIDPALSGTGARLVARDENGATVTNIALSGQAGPLEWAGVGTDGMPLARGTYRFSALQSAEGGGFSEHPVSVYARVTEVRFSPDGDAEIVFASGDTTMVEAVNGLREAASPPRE
ncbi:flagellar hook capping FlgD N-terminal domain-containing protein [Pelagovum sp. HNIBRBA483]|uniref:flagellar hook capping FlgD N-terminal domain-containing protein n=1 Tax=Pelagovum sp. HNIBRBA483 TaxID=3233341 RepID=UPI0034A1214C